MTNYPLTMCTQQQLCCHILLLMKSRTVAFCYSITKGIKIHLTMLLVNYKYEVTQFHVFTAIHALRILFSCQVQYLKYVYSFTFETSKDFYSILIIYLKHFFSAHCFVHSVFKREVWTVLFLYTQPKLSFWDGPVWSDSYLVFVKLCT